MKLQLPSGEVRLAANLKWLFTELPFEQRFDAAAAAGFTGVEFASPYEFPAEQVRQFADAAGVTQVLINTPAGPAGSPTQMGAGFTPTARDEFRAGVERALEYASVLGSSVIHVMAGVRPADIEPERAFAAYIDNIVWAADRARGSGVRLALEAINQRDQPGYGLESMEQAAEVVHAIDEDVLGVLFDVYHAQVDRGNLIERFEQLQPFVAHVQIADNPGRAEPGTGEINYARVLDRIAASDYDGWVGLEYGPVGETAAGLAWTRSITA